MPRLTLNRVFAISLAGLLIGLGLLFWVVFNGLQTALLKSAEQSRDKNSEVIAQSVNDYLDQAPAAVENFESLLWVGFTKPADLRSLRDGLLDVLLENGDISEATFTFAKRTGYDAGGKSVVDPATVGQVAIFRAKNGAGFVHRTTTYDSGRYLATHFHLSRDGTETQVEAPGEVPNPATHATFITPARRMFDGQLLWTDLYWFAVDEALPEDQRRVEVSVQKAIEYPPGHFAGVLRIGLFKDKIDHAIENPPAVDTATHTIFLCDTDGRLIALSGSNRYLDSGEDVRLEPTGAPAPVMAALQRPELHALGDQNPVVSGSFVISGTDYLYTFRDLPDTLSWAVGITVPKNAYLGDLVMIRNRVFVGSLLLVFAIAVGGLITLHAVSRAHSVIVREAAQMNDFVLEPSNHSCRFYDINRVLASLERAKTAMRSMGKYIPLDLVRRLYHRGEEPRLGGEATELSALFTDIQDFTQFAEGSDTDTVANRLGEYLEVMVSVIQREKGTIDKFIGDSVMAFWNAPEPVPDNAALACRAVLACREALAKLYASPRWEGAPGFETRFGLHHCVASVGHFGAPERFNYTAIGDGINLASRLERLNKHYGTTIIVSAGIRDAVGPEYRFRHLDRVAVKGKTQSLDIYELIGDAASPMPAHVPIYEQALASWFDGDFTRALALAESQPGDPPSIFLAARCRLMIADPPAGWRGVYAFETK